MGFPPFPRAVARAIPIVAVSIGVAAHAAGNERWPRAGAVSVVVVAAAAAGDDEA